METAELTCRIERKHPTESRRRMIREHVAAAEASETRRRRAVRALKK